MRLIDADALAKKAYDVAYPIIHGRNDHERGLTLSGIAQLLDEMPVVEAVPVIRCKDCKHYIGKWCTKYSTKQFDINDIWDDNDFCSRAERKED